MVELLNRLATETGEESELPCEKVLDRSPSFATDQPRDLEQYLATLLQLLHFYMITTSALKAEVMMSFDICGKLCIMSGTCRVLRNY